MNSRQIAAILKDKGVSSSLTIVKRLERLYREYHRPGKTLVLSVKERGQLATLVKRIGADDAEGVFREVVSKWSEYALYMKSCPPYPHIGYMLATAQSMVDFTQLSQNSAENPAYTLENVSLPKINVKQTYPNAVMKDLLECL